MFEFGEIVEFGGILPFGGIWPFCGDVSSRQLILPLSYMLSPFFVSANTRAALILLRALAVR